MDENLLKYFTGNGEPTTEIIMPQLNKYGEVSGQTTIYNRLMKTNDNKYCIRYGGPMTPTQNYNTLIEVYNTDSIMTRSTNIILF